MTVVAPPVWFVTGPATADDLVSRSPRIPDLVVHAKTMGTSHTACGRDATTWAKRWDTPFKAASSAHQCHSCGAFMRAVESVGRPMR